MFNSSTICCCSATPPCGSKVGAFQALTQRDTPLPGPLQSQVGTIGLNSKLSAYMAKDNTSSTGQINQLTSMRASADGLNLPTSIHTLTGGVTESTSAKPSAGGTASPPSIHTSTSRFARLNSANPSANGMNQPTSSTLPLADSLNPPPSTLP